MSCNWPLARLGDNCTKIGSGATPRGGKKVYLEEGKFALIRSQNVYNDGFSKDGLAYITSEAAEKLDNVEVMESDILLNITGDSVARTCMSPKEFLPARVNQHVAIIRPRPKELDAQFVRYFLTTPVMQAEMLTIASAGGTRNALTKSDIEGFEVPKPSLGVQKSIVNHLAALDSKIQLNQQINQTLEQMAQAIFKSWFVDFEPVKAKIAALENGGSEEDANLAAMQAISGKTLAELQQLKTETPDHYQQLHTTAQHFPAAMQDSELGEIPEGWEVSPVENILERLKTKKRYSKKQVANDGVTPVFEQGANILLGYHDDEPSLNASIEEPIFIFGDHTCITHLSCSSFDVSQNVIPLKGNGFPTIWTYYAIQGKQEFQEYRRHWAELIVKQTVLPSKTLSNIYTKKVTSLIQKKEQVERENRVLSSLRDELLPKLLSGELSLADLPQAELTQ